MSNLEYLENFMTKFNANRKSIIEFNALFDEAISVPDISDLEKELGITPPDFKMWEQEIGITNYETILPWEKY